MTYKTRVAYSLRLTYKKSAFHHLCTVCMQMNSFSHHRNVVNCFQHMHNVVLCKSWSVPVFYAKQQKCVNNRYR